jgi:hypothetical protein
MSGITLFVHSVQKKNRAVKIFKSQSGGDVA